MSIVYLRARGNPVKAVFTALKELLTDVNLQFTAKELLVTGVDPEQIATAHQTLTPPVYETLLKPGETVFIGVYIPTIYKLFRGIGVDFEVEMKISENSPDVLQIQTSSANGSIKQFTALKSINVPVEIVVIPQYSFAAVANVPSAHFYRVLRDLAQFSNRVSIGYKDKQVHVVASGNMGVASVDIKVDWLLEPLESDVYSSEHVLKFVEKMVKHELNKYVQVRFKKGGPLVLVYTLGETGVLTYVLAPLLV